MVYSSIWWKTREKLDKCHTFIVYPLSIDEEGEDIYNQEDELRVFDLEALR
jgi:hypothetical protein